MRGQNPVLARLHRDPRLAMLVTATVRSRHPIGKRNAPLFLHTGPLNWGFERRSESRKVPGEAFFDHRLTARRHRSASAPQGLRVTDRRENMAEIKGADLLAKSLKEQGVEYMFGVVGFPVGPIAEAAQKIGGPSETFRNGMGAFQEERQVLAATPVSKWAHAIEHVNRIPFYVEMAVRQSIYGRPGASYLDIADDIITGSCDTDQVVQVQKCPEPPRTQAMPQDIEKALDVLQSAERPLVLLGQGMAYSGATEEVRAFLEKIQVPFVRTPKGKGIMPDDHPLSAGAARTLALQQADVVFLMGARFNWIRK